MFWIRKFHTKGNAFANMFVLVDNMAVVLSFARGRSINYTVHSRSQVLDVVQDKRYSTVASMA